MTESTQLNSESMKKKILSPILRFNSDFKSSDVNNLATSLKISPILAEILILREINTFEKAKSFLNPTLRNDLPDPSTLKNAIEAVSLIIQSLKDNKYITIFSDFDVDGISSAAQLWLILKDTSAKLRYYVPNRIKEGYGLSSEAITKLHKEKTNLLITLDCGITNNLEVKLAKDLGMDVIIVDHHELSSEIPPANYIINHMQKDCGFHETKLCTAGLMWLIGILLIKELHNQNLYKKDSYQPTNSKDLLDLAAIGTICDMVPLRGVNRLIASRGIDAIRDKARPGVKAIQEIANIPQGSRFSCSSIAFGIGPRLNAAGRLDDASIGMTLLTTESQTEAKNLAIKINSLNTQRRSFEEEVKSICLDLASEFSKKIGEPPFAYALYDSSFHVGVIGIAAQRMVENLSRPVAVIGKTDDQENNKIAKGSVRSLNNFHISETLQKLSHLLITHGGHKEAGGFSILEENIEKFGVEFNRLAKEFFQEKTPENYIKIDKELQFKDIDIKLVKELELLAPFGVGNPSPVFFTSNVEILNFQVIGTNHIKFELSHEKTIRNAIGWRMLGHPSLERGQMIDITFSLELNTYKGISSVQLIIKEMANNN